MYQYKYPNELYHYGVLGMKWGKRKQQETTYRSKLTKLNKNSKVDARDQERFKYRNQNLATRVGKNAASSIAVMLAGDILTGRLSRYGTMSKSQLKKELTKKAIALTVNTATTTALKDALAKYASTRYTDEGRKKKRR